MSRNCKISGSALGLLRFLLFWDFVQHKLLVGYQHFMAPYRHLEMSLICCPKTSVTNHQYMLCNIPEIYRSHRNHSYLDTKLYVVT